MHQIDSNGGPAPRLSPSAIAANGGDLKRTTAMPAFGAIPKVLLTIAEAGQLLGLKERRAHDVVPKLVTPVVLGPRCVRIVRSELEAAVAKLPRRTEPAEPAQLLRGKIERLKRGASLSPSACAR